MTDFDRGVDSSTVAKAQPGFAVFLNRVGTLTIERSDGDWITLPLEYVPAVAEAMMEAIGLSLNGEKVTATRTVSTPKDAKGAERARRYRQKKRDARDASRDAKGGVMAGRA